MSTAAERADQLDLVARLKSAYPELPDAPSPDLLDHDRFTAYMKPVHDVGGEPVFGGAAVLPSRDVRAEAQRGNCAVRVHSGVEIRSLAG